jgi:hypothetical protein
VLTYENEGNEDTMEKLKLNNRSGKLQEEGRTAALGVRGYSDLSSTKPSSWYGEGPKTIHEDPSPRIL